MIRTFVERPIGTSMGALAVALLGVVACLRLPVDLLPSLELPRVSVQVRLEDAPAPEVEELVTIPVEQALSGAPGVQEVDSLSRDGLASITLAFPWMTDVDLAILDVRERLDEVRDTLPEAASPPTVQRWDPGNRPFAVLAASIAYGRVLGPNLGEEKAANVPATSIAVGGGEASRLVALSQAIREVLRPRLEQLDGVASAELEGDLDERVLVEMDPARARLLDVAPTEVAQAIRRAVAMPESGTLRRGPYRYSLRVPALVQSPADFEAIMVSEPGADPSVRLADVARARVVPGEPQTVLRFDGRPAVGVRLYKDADANALAVTDLVHRQLDAFRAEHPDIRLDVAYEQAGFIRAALGGALTSVLLGGVLAFGVLFCFLGDWRQPVVIGVVVPVAVLGALAAMDWLDVSINLISLGGLALGIGLLVNTAIIVVENVHRQREQGLPAAAAAAAGTAQVAAPITSVTITTLVVFLPLVAAGGFAGALFRDQAIAVSAAVLVAWAAALTLVPALSARLAGRGVVRAPREPWTLPVRWLLGTLLRRRGLALAGAAAFVAAAAVLAVRTPREVAPPVDTGDLRVTAEPRHRMTVEHLARAAVRLEETLRTAAGANRVLATAGVQVDNALTGNGSMRRNGVRAQFRVDDTTGQDGLGAALERSLPSFDVRVEPTETPLHDVLGMLAGPIDIAFSGPDLAELRRAAEAFAAEVAGRGDLGRIVAAPLEPEEQLRLDLDPRALGELGLSTADVAEQVGFVTRGETVAQLRIADPPLQVVLRHPLAQGAPAAWTLDRIPIMPPRRPAGGGDAETRERLPRVPLGALGTLVSETAPAEIARRGHRRTLTLGVDPGGAPRAALEQRLDEALSQLALPPEVRAQVRTRRADAAEALASLRWVLLISLVLVTLCLSAEFESVRLALAVLLAVPLTLSGVAVTWWLFGLTLNVFTGMAAAVLIGIGVDDAVVMVDFMRRRHRDAAPGGARSAIVEAALLRVRPILMTTVTTVLAVAPLALTSAPAQELQRALALTLIGGLSASTVLSICFVPLLYELLAPAPAEEAARC